MTNSEIAHLFQRAYNGQRNFMTPNLVRYGARHGKVYEVSWGEGFGRERIYGVTVLTENGAKCSDLNAAFTHLEAANQYIKNGYRMEELS